MDKRQNWTARFLRLFLLTDREFRGDPSVYSDCLGPGGAADIIYFEIGWILVAGEPGEGLVLGWWPCKNYVAVLSYRNLL